MKQRYLIITGATSGIGLATLNRLSKSDNVIIAIGRNVEAIPKASNIIPTKLDLHSPDEIESFCNSLTSKDIYVDSLIHCAGIAPISKLGDFDYTTILETYSTNTFSFLHLMNSLHKQGRLAKSGSVVAISSVVAEKPNFSQCVYGSSKAALNYLVQNLAKILFHDGIRVNALELGCVKTPMFEKLNNSDDHINECTFGVIDMDVVVEEIIHLISHESRFTTGSIIKLDSGYTLNI